MIALGNMVQPVSAWLAFSDWVLLTGMTLVVAGWLAHTRLRRATLAGGRAAAEAAGDPDRQGRAARGDAGAMITTDDLPDGAPATLEPATRQAEPPRLTAAERLERDRQERATRRDLDVLATEIEDMARRVGEDLERKAARLERLLAEADHRIARLQAATERDAGHATPRHDPPSAGDPASPDAASGSGPPRHAAPNLDGGARPALTDNGMVDPLTRRVHDLSDRGRSAAEIAQALNEHVGKVELILALRNTDDGT